MILSFLSKVKYEWCIHAHKIRSLYFYDRGNNINRRYLSLKEDDGVRSSYHLYEIVITGKVDVLRRKKMSAFSEHPD